MNLHFAAKYGRTEIALALIEKGADVNAADQDGYTPLNWAAARGHTEIALALIEKGADVNATNKYGETPIHQATRYSYTEILIALIAAGADDNVADQFGLAPLHSAVENGLTEIARAIEHPLHWAARLSDIKTVKALIDKGYDPQAKLDDKTPLEHAIAADNLNVAKYLITLSDVKTIKAFIDKGYNLQAKLDDKTPLEHAIAADNLNVARYLIARTKPNFSDLNMPEIDNRTTTFLKLVQSEHDALTVAGNEIQNEVAAKLTSMVQSTVDIHNSKIDFAKALFGMPTTDKAKAMVKFMMFNLTFKVKDSYIIAIDLSRGLATKKPGGKHVPCDVSQLIMQFAGLLPKGVDLSKIMQGTKPHSSQQVAMAPPSSLVTSVILENISSSSSSSSKSNNT
ncbi:MAG: hypothetical protein HON78_02090 [Legionellales bacterium]|jgi:ankyrin repeat protein|nr:hypothetical protein [Legionellales bacterium]